MQHRHLATLALIAVTAAQAGAPEAAIVVEGTLEASLGQPMVQVRLVDGRRVLTGRPTDLEQALGEGNHRVESFPAFLDTGASSFVISRLTAERFGVESAPGAAYQEVGLHGAVAMGVSRPYGLALAGHDPGGGRVEFKTVEREARLLLNRSGEAPIWQLLAAGVDVIGMPAIQRLAVEIVPASPKAPHAARRAGGAGGTGGEAGDGLEDLEALQDLLKPPAVRLHDRCPRIGPGDLVITLEYMDFNQRRRARNAGPLPALAANPVIPGIAVDHDGRSLTCNWLLDTGAASSIICTAHAQRLGLFDETGRPARAPDFQLTVTGISGTAQQHPGFILDRLRIAAGRDRTIEYRRVRVIVRDVSVQRGEGTVVLDGVFGMNLLLASATGLGDGLPDEVADAPFQRIWLDGRGRQMILQRR